MDVSFTSGVQLSKQLDSTMSPALGDKGALSVSQPMSLPWELKNL